MKSKILKIGESRWEVKSSPKINKEIVDKIFKWMEDKNHSSSFSGEAIMQSDNTIIDAPELIADIVDNILKPKHLNEFDSEE